MHVDAFAVDVPFIGRVDELASVRRALDDARAGQPRLVLVAGEAGVGKSRLVTEATTAAAAAGWTVLAGTCHEDVAIPYLPIATAFRPLPHPVARRIVPSARVPTAAVGDGAAEDRRVELCLDATAALIESAETGPTLLVVEDVQWADEASAELIRHLLLSGLHEATSASLPLVAVLTARDGWPDGVPRSLARLAREATALELHLGQFGVVEAHAMVSAMTGARARTEVTTAILDATAGNPLLMRGVIARNLASERLVAADGEVTLAGDGPLAAPTDLDDEIRIRLSGVSGPARELLTVAAVIGDGGALVVLRSAAGAADDGPLTEAVEAGLITCGATRYRFVHPQMRQVLYGDLPTPARADAHLRVAAVLEARAGAGGDDQALAIAHHLRRGGADADDERVASWALRAGDQAWSTGAWAEATTAYAVALGGAARRRLAPADVTEVLLRAGVAAYYANDDSCTRWLAEAADLAADRGDLARRAEALLLRARFRLIGTAATLGAPPRVAELEELLEALQDEPSLRARTLATLSDLYLVGLDPERAADFAQQAEAVIAGGGADTATEARVAFVLGLQEMGSLDLAPAQRHFSRVVETGDDHLALAAEARIGLLQMAEGRVSDAAATLARARVGLRRLSSHAGQQLPSAAIAGIRLLRGEFAAAERLAAEVRTLYEIQPYAFTPGMVMPLLAAARVERGDAVGAREVIEQWRAHGGRGTWRHDALVRAMAGEADAVAGDLSVRRWPDVSATPSFFTLDGPCLHVAVGTLVDDPALVRNGLPPLERAHASGVVLTIGWPWLVSRLVADGHTALGDLAAAERWYRRAGAEAASGSLVVERAMVTLGRARLALADGRPHEAVRLASESAADLDAVDALVLARAARQTAERAGGHVAPPPRDRIVLVTDMVGSTELNVRSGDELYVSLIKEHDRILRARLRRHDGVEHTHTGDGISAWFTSAAAALDCAFGILADLERASLAHPELPIRVRIGMSSGRPVDTGDNLFGLTVVASARICALADADQVFVSDDVRAAAADTHRFRAVGDRTLKGLPGRHVIHEALDLPSR